MQFSNQYDSLEGGKFFDTIWTAFPQEAMDYYVDLFQPISPYCEYIVGMKGDNDANNYLHITLRYLGYDDHALREHAIQDKSKFEEVIRSLGDITISLGRFSVWKSDPEVSNPTARINWQIADASYITQLHNALLEVNGYAFYKNLEGDSFHPHVGLGKVNLRMPNAIGEIETYLNMLPEKLHTFTLKEFAINFSSENPDLRQQIKLNI